MDNLIKHFGSSYSGADANPIAVVGAKGKDKALIKRLLSGQTCIFLKKHEAEPHLTTGFDVLIYVHRCPSIEPTPLPLFDQSKRAIVISNCGEEDIIVNALYAGADYYFDIEESERILSHRFEAALRSHTNVHKKLIAFPPYVFDIATRTLYNDDQEIQLTHREFELALYLFLNRGKLVKDSDLLTWVWGLSPAVGTRRISTTMYQVNKKLRLHSASTRWDLKRFYAQGYRLVEKQNSHY